MRYFHLEYFTKITDFVNPVRITKC